MPMPLRMTSEYVESHVCLETVAMGWVPGKPGRWHPPGGAPAGYSVLGERRPQLAAEHSKPQERALAGGPGPMVDSLVLPLSPLEAWLTGGPPTSSEQTALDLPVSEPLVGLLEEDVAIPSEAIDLHFLARTER